MKDRPVTSCCKTPAVAEPLYFLADGRKTRFASVSICTECRKVKGGVRPDYSDGNADLKRIQALFNGTSEAAMLDHGIDRPLIFELGSIGIMFPQGYKGAVKAQPDLDEEVPF